MLSTTNSAEKMNRGHLVEQKISYLSQESRCQAAVKSSKTFFGGHGPPTVQHPSIGGSSVTSIRNLTYKKAWNATNL